MYRRDSLGSIFLRGEKRDSLCAALTGLFIILSVKYKNIDCVYHTGKVEQPGHLKSARDNRISRCHSLLPDTSYNLLIYIHASRVETGRRSEPKH